MIRIIDTLPQLPMLFEGGFDIERWSCYMDALYPGSAAMLRNELQRYWDTGRYTWEKDFLPIIAAVENHPALPLLHASFLRTVDGLDPRVSACFGRSLDVDVTLYLGLCNAAGWVTKMNGRDAVLLGVEKILELNWCSEDAMRGLIYHELGHVYQAQYGVLEREIDDGADDFLWQLFTEGIAMVFEQALVGDTDYFHQDHDGWKAWCAAHIEEIRTDFAADLPRMTDVDQRWFGDWVRYHGWGDVGYYLAADFVHFLLRTYRFDDLLAWDMPQVRAGWVSYIRPCHPAPKGV